MSVEEFGGAPRPVQRAARHDDGVRLDIAGVDAEDLLREREREEGEEETEDRGEEKNAEDKSAEAQEERLRGGGGGERQNHVGQNNH